MAEIWSYSLTFRGEPFELEVRPLTVGRSRTCDVSIKDPSVSRRHAELTPGGGGIKVRDLGSSNGTFINGQRVAESGELLDGDTLGLGDADLSVRVESNAPYELPGLEASEAESEAAADRVPGQMGEATGILQAESMRLAQEALDEAVPPAETPVPPPPPAATPGAHMAPMAPAPVSGVEPPAPAAPPGETPSPLATMALPSLDEAEAPPAELSPAEPSEPPSPMVTQAIPSLAGQPPQDAPPPPETAAPDDSPMATQLIPNLAGQPPQDAPPPPETAAPDESPMMTQAIPEIELAGGAMGDDPPALDFPELEPEPETEKVSLVDRDAQPLPEPIPEPPVAMEAEPQAVVTEPEPMAPPPEAPPPTALDELPAPVPPPPAEPMKDIREATLGSPQDEPLPPPSGGKGEILPSLDGFDTTLGPGVPIPESMQRAHESLARTKEAQGEAGEPLASIYQQPTQLPPVAGFWIRALALLLDGAWLGPLVYGGWLYQGLAGAAAACATGLLVILAGWSIWGTTPGKRLCRLYICNQDGQAGLGVPRAVLRLVAYPLSALPLGAGFLMILSASRRGLHDRLAGTWVRRYA